MNPALLTLQAFAAFGIAWVLGHSKITLAFRYWLGGSVAENKPPKFGRFGYWAISLIECPACLGFWTGLIYAFAVGEQWRFALTRAFACLVSNMLLSHALKIVRYG